MKERGEGEKAGERPLYYGLQRIEIFPERPCPGFDLWRAQICAAHEAGDRRAFIKFSYRLSAAMAQADAKRAHAEAGGRAA